MLWRCDCKRKCTWSDGSPTGGKPAPKIWVLDHQSQIHWNVLCTYIHIHIYIYILCRLWCIKYVSNNFRETLKDGWWCLKKTHKLGAESFQSLVESVSRCASVNQEMQGSMIPNPRRPQVDWNYIYQKMASFLFAKGFFFLKLGLPQTIQWLLYQKHSNTTNFWRIFWSWGPPWLKVLT